MQGIYAGPPNAALMVVTVVLIITLNEFVIKWIISNVVWGILPFSPV